jgi:hypothetical protein
MPLKSSGTLLYAAAHAYYLLPSGDRVRTCWFGLLIIDHFMGMIISACVQLAPQLGIIQCWPAFQHRTVVAGVPFAYRVCLAAGNAACTYCSS